MARHMFRLRGGALGYLPVGNFPVNTPPGTAQQSLIGDVLDDGVAKSVAPFRLDQDVGGNQAVETLAQGGAINARQVGKIRLVEGASDNRGVPRHALRRTECVEPRLQ